MTDMKWEARRDRSGGGYTVYVLSVNGQGIGRVFPSEEAWQDFVARMRLVEGQGGVWRTVGEAETKKDLSEDLPAALPECLFKYCPTLDKCGADGCRQPRPERSPSDTDRKADG